MFFKSAPPRPCQGDDNGNENIKKAISWTSKTTTWHLQTTFCSVLSLLSPYDYGVKMPNFSFYGRCRYETTNLFSVRSWIWFLGSELQERSLTFVIIVVKITCWRTRIHFLSDAFTASPPRYLNFYLWSQRVHGFLLPCPCLICWWLCLNITTDFIPARANVLLF